MKIAVIHLNQIGDLVFSLPLLRALRENYPGAEIHSIVRPYLQELLVSSPDVHQVIRRESGVRSLLSLLGEIRKNRYDLLFSLSNSIECLFLATWSRARVKVGFSNFPWSWRLDIQETVEGHPSWYNNLKLLKRLDLEVEKRDYINLLFLLPESESMKISGSYVVISPGTSGRRKIKAWEDKRFAELIGLLKERYDFNPVLVGGKGDEEEIDRIVQWANVNPIFNLAGKASLREVCHLLKKAKLFVGIDSGIMHLASSLDIPVVGLFGPSDPFFVGPQNARSRVVREEMPCAPCYFRGCEKRECMTKLDVQRVFAACEQVLRSEDEGRLR